MVASAPVLDTPAAAIAVAVPWPTWSRTEGSGSFSAKQTGIAARDDHLVIGEREIAHRAGDRESRRRGKSGIVEAGVADLDTAIDHADHHAGAGVGEPDLRPDIGYVMQWQRVIERHLEAAHRIDRLNARRSRQFAGLLIGNLHQQRVAQGLQRAADASAGLFNCGPRAGLLCVDGGAMLFGVGGMQPCVNAPSRRIPRGMDGDRLDGELNDVAVGNGGGEKRERTKTRPKTGA